MLLLFTLFTVTFARYVDLPSKALQDPDLFQGDIIGIEDNDVRNAVSNLSLRWKGGIVYYTIDHHLKNIKPLIKQAMNHINNATGGCITFKERKKERDYVRFIKGLGCYSNLGRSGGEQTLSLGSRCEFIGTVVHEILHTLGFYHEQNRPDRDDYLIVHWDNIDKGDQFQFKIFDPHVLTIYNDFDLHSIMMYGNYAFSKDGKSKTMEAKSGVRLLDPFKKSGLTSSDVYRIKKLYDCS
ncbi:astacin-like metalloprotease toxin 5 [Centruroides vittatus]|uniref:astacin-like metalloprotease toxin 5 n=1 Tax=Centruroides vittatus TaxID=120091 RepID=UPI00350F8BA5